MSHEEMPSEINIRFNPRGAANGLRASIQRIRDSTSFGLVASQHLVSSPPTVSSVLGKDYSHARGDDPDTPFTAEHLWLVGSRLSMQIGARPDDASLDALRADFDTRLLAVAFHECVRVLSSFLLDVRNLARTAREILGRDTLTMEELQALTNRRDTRFDRLTFDRKLEVLASEYQIAPDAELSECINSVIVARNCLEHRNGIVGVEDVNAYGSLAVKWRRIRLVGSSSGKEIHFGESTTEGIALQANAPGIRVFNFGDRIEFTHDEFTGICWTFSIYADAVAQGLEGFLQAAGVEPESSEAPLPDGQ